VNAVWRQTIPTNDLWIAASTMEHGTELVTSHRDFTHVPQILVTLYERQNVPKIG
jgi:predicted nucleic acid-binding protein